MKSNDQHCFVLVMHEEAFVTYANATGPAEAVERHYQEMDLYCSSDEAADPSCPIDESFYEVFKVAESKLEAMEPLFEDLYDDERVDAVLECLEDEASWNVVARFRGNEFLSASVVDD